MSKNITLADIQELTMESLTKGLLQDLYNDIDSKITQAAKKGNASVDYCLPIDCEICRFKIMSEYDEFKPHYHYCEPDGIHPGSHWITFKW